MEIKFNEAENTIEIKDGLRKVYLIIKILMVLNLANAIIRIIRKEASEYGLIEYIWIGVGIVSLVVLVVSLFKMSTAQIIPVGEITRVKEKTVFGNEVLTLKLKNGKKRNLGNFKDQSELARVRELFTKIGIVD
jgi:hypothetical protein